MKNYIIYSLVLFSLTFSSCLNKKTKDLGFEIIGTMKNAPKNTYVYVNYSGIIDSTLIASGNFKIKGQVIEPTKATLFLKNSRDRKSLWLENSNIVLIADEGSLKSSMVTGGKVQEVANLHEERKLPILKEIESADYVLSTGNLSKQEQDSVYSNLEDLIEKLSKSSKKFIKEFPNSFESVFTLNANKTRWNKQLITELFSLMDYKTKDTSYGRSITRYLHLNKNPQIGEKYIDFEQENIEGERVKFSSLKGQYTLIDFWASWCAPCRKSNPSLLKLYSKYHENRFNIVGVSLDNDRDNWIKAINDDGLTWYNLTDLKDNENEAVVIYNVIGIPDNILLDSEGVIIKRGIKIDDLAANLKMKFDK